MTETQVDEIVRQFDANGDGVLSVDELAAGWNAGATNFWADFLDCDKFSK